MKMIFIMDNENKPIHWNDHIVVVTEELEVPEGLEDQPAVIVYNSQKEPISLTHRNLVAAASALVKEYHIR